MAFPVHPAGIDLEDYWLAPSGPNFGGSLDIFRQMHVMPFPFLETA